MNLKSKWFFNFFEIKLFINIEKKKIVILPEHKLCKKKYLSSNCLVLLLNILTHRIRQCYRTQILFIVKMNIFY